MNEANSSPNIEYIECEYKYVNVVLNIKHTKLGRQWILM